jgi:uncharacterized protein YdiU (UPF0061 family)
MHNKLGLHNSPGQKKLIDDLFETMDICSSHFTNVFRILEKNLSGEINEKTKDQIVEELLNESCPTQFYLKNLRAFPQLVGKPYD